MRLCCEDRVRVAAKLQGNSQLSLSQAPRSSTVFLVSSTCLKTAKLRRLGLNRHPVLSGH